MTGLVGQYQYGDKVYVGLKYTSTDIITQLPRRACGNIKVTKISRNEYCIVALKERIMSHKMCITINDVFFYEP